MNFKKQKLEKLRDEIAIAVMDSEKFAICSRGLEIVMLINEIIEMLDNPNISKGKTKSQMYDDLMWNISPGQGGY